MKRTFLKSKLKEVKVTEANTEYEGSITIDEDLMDAAELKEYERVEVNGKTNPSRIVTYVIAGKRGSGIIAMNGGASLHFKKGDKVHVLCYADFGTRQIDMYMAIYPIIIKTDENNKIIKNEK